MDRIVIIGAGPTGLGAAWRLCEVGHSDWQLLEASTGAGGLATSFLDPRGFTWDVGGHVQFSHYEYFDSVMDELLGRDGWVHHQRESWIWMRDRFVPYPLQNNIHRLPADDLERCLSGLLDVALSPRPAAQDFREWLVGTFGRGLAEVFLLPYNFKVWAYPAEMLGAGWVGERVAVLDLKRILSNLVRLRDDVSWGPNSTFRFPLRGGTGAIWDACAERLPLDRLHFGDPVVSIDAGRRRVTTAGGAVHDYDHLISTMPLSDLIVLAGQDHLVEVANRGLLYSSTNIFGIGLRGSPPEHLRTKCWVYFPEDNCPFYRVTVFSNYSPHNTPPDGEYWSLMAEVAESPFKPVDLSTLEYAVIEGLLATKLMPRREDIVSRWRYRANHGYPTPARERDAALSEITPQLEALGIYSRGRFGAWKYEISNQDHSFMQGVEWVERVLHAKPEVTLNQADRVNAAKQPWPYDHSADLAAR